MKIYIQLILFFEMLILNQALIRSGGIVVHPTDVVVVTGQSVSLHCNAPGNGCIDSWKLGNDISNSTAVYKARYNNGTHRIPKFVAEKYKVNDSIEGVTVLMMKAIELSMGGLYHCLCHHPKSSATGNVAVIAFEPTFTEDDRDETSQGRSFTCSISFNGSSNASFEMLIKDFDGNILGHQNNLPFSRNQTRYNLPFVTNATDFSIKPCFCKVTLKNSSSTIIYSKVANMTSTNGGRHLSTPIELSVVQVVIMLILTELITGKLHDGTFREAHS